MYETGFAVKGPFAVDALAWVTEDVNGASVEAAHAPDVPAFIEEGRLPEVYAGLLELSDGSVPRARLRLRSGNYLVGEVSAGDVVDLNEYAANRIAAFRMEHDDEDLRGIAQSWVAEKRILCWKSRAPRPLKDGQRVQATGLSDAGLAVVSVPGGLDLRIEFSDLTLTSLEDSEQESQERQLTYGRRAVQPVMSVEEVMELLRTVDVIRPYLPERPTSTVKVTDSDDLFTLQAHGHLQGSGRNVKPEEINAFADRSTQPITIRLRRRAKGVGTEVHEMLHTLSVEKYRAKSWFFFDEGITEYLTRKATDGRYEREDAYSDNRGFIQSLVIRGATDDATLAELYFTGDWESFEKGVRTFAGDGVSFRELRKANAATALAVCDYLRELSANKRAPLGQ